MLYSFKNISISSKAELNNYISDEQILTFYFKEFELNTHYLSPFHPEKNPSFIISYFNDQLRWRDFGISNRPSDVIDFVSKLFNIGFIDSLNKIYNDIVIGNKKSNTCCCRISNCNCRYYPIGGGNLITCPIKMVIGYGQIISI